MIKKPYPGTLLKAGHPSTNGLVACWPLNDGIGGRIRDVKGRHYGIADGAGGVPSYVQGNPDFDNTASKYYSIQNHAELFTGQISIYFILRDISVANNSYIFAHKKGDNDSGYQFRQSTDGRLWAQFYDDLSATAIEWKYFPAWTSTRRGLLMVLDVTNELVGMYINGERWEGQGRWQATGTITDPTSAGYMKLGHGYYSSPADCQIECCYMWDRLIEDHEAACLWRDPYGMFQDLDYGFLSEVAAGGISIPLLLQQMNQFNGGQPTL